MTQSPAFDPKDGARIAASLLGVPFAQLGADVWRCAEWMEAAGNKGYEKSALKPYAEHPEIQLPVYFLRADMEPVWKGMLFYGSGTRKRDFSGWGVRKAPHWKTVWVTLYGDTDPVRAAEVAAAEALKAERAAAEEALRKARPRERFSQGAFEHFTTLQIGQRMAIAAVLKERARFQRFNCADNGDVQPIPEETKKRRNFTLDTMDSAEAYIFMVWEDEYEKMIGELQYRADHLADELAAELLKGRADYFYTGRTINHWVQGDRFPVFVDGYAGQPYDDIKGVPLDRLPDHGVIRRFMRLLDPDWDRIGKYAQDDLEVIVGILRRQLEKLKPQG